jgi:hypothetical protein
VVKLIEVVKDMLRIPIRTVCATLELAYSTYMRWKGRAARGEVLVKKPGPQRVPPLEVEGLMEKIRSLGHRKRRSLGVQCLFDEYKDRVSRRSFQELVFLAREEVKRAARAAMRRICWKQPGLVYSIDDSMCGRDEDYRKLFVHSVRDLPSRYQFKPLGGDFAAGPKVAKNLERLFERYGPPLILKRDGHGNLKHEDVEDVLSRHMVIPLTSPRYYPPYNGAVEKSQSELKQGIRRRHKALLGLPRRHFSVYAESAAGELNHMPRRSLQGKTSCQVFFSEKGGAKFSKRQRREIFDWIKDLSCAIMVQLGKPGKRAAQTAWRLAVESWLNINGFIEMSVNGEVLPIFPPNLSH